MISISESGMTFGPFEDKQIYHIEKSALQKSLCSVKTVEFVLNRDAGSIKFIEAKSSSPNPNGKSAENFDEFICEISRKFIHSLNLYYAAILERHSKTDDMPKAFKQLNNSKLKICFILVIKGHEMEWLPPIYEALNRKLMSFEAIWKFDIMVINDTIAAQYGLIEKQV